MTPLHPGGPIMGRRGAWVRSAGAIGSAQVADTLKRFVGLVHLAAGVVTVGFVNDWYPVVTTRDPVESDELLSLTALIVTLAVAAWSWQAVRLERRLRSQVAAATASHRQILATTRDWVWTITDGATLVSTNDAVGELLGLRSADLIGCSLLDLLHDDERDETAHRLLDVSSTVDGWTGWVRRWRHADGSYRHLESDGVPLLDASGALIGYRGADRDITERVKRLEVAAVTAAERAALRAGIEAMLADPGRHLVTVFQPIVGLQDGVVVGAEALARFSSEPHRPPDEWFAAAFEVGLGLELELLAVRLGLAGLSSITAGYVSVNVSPSTLVSPQFAAVLRDSRAPAHRVVLELTEHVEVAEYNDLRRAVNTLREHGFRLAVDDAGAGYSSFQHILELRPDFIKLDRTIVRGVADDPARRALATAVADFAADIGAAVVAEGVEEADEVIALRAAGVTCGQGYFFARPGSLPLPEVAELPTSIGGRVIIVDDDPVVRLLVASMARRAGFDVVGQASDGEEGTALVSAMRPDVVVLDLSMPVLDGAAALPLVRALVPRASIIVLSSRADPDTAEAAIQRGADSFVAKSDSATLLPRLFEQLRCPVARSVV